MAVNNGINTYPGLNDVWDGGEEVLDDALVQVPFTLDLAVLQQLRQTFPVIHVHTDQVPSHVGIQWSLGKRLAFSLLSGSGDFLCSLTIETVIVLKPYTV